MKQHGHFGNTWLSFKLFKIPPTSLIQKKNHTQISLSKSLKKELTCSSLCYLKCVQDLSEKGWSQKVSILFHNKLLLGECLFHMMFFALRAILLLFKKEWGSNSQSSIESILLCMKAAPKDSQKLILCPYFSGTETNLYKEKQSLFLFETGALRRTPH